MIDLFPRFADIIRNLSTTELMRPQASAPLELHRDHLDRRRDVRMIYAPFDHVNETAKIAIVGITPGAQQAINALRAARMALEQGRSLTEASKRAKVFASFSGAMRPKLVEMMDSVGLNGALGISSTASLWDKDAHLVHFTSALRYPIFVNEQNWSGSSPSALRSAAMREWLERYTGEELRKLNEAMIVPLGDKVTTMLKYLAEEGSIREDQILAGLPHPSGSNSERIKYFLGQKPAERLSIKTNAAALDSARETIISRVRGFG